MKLAELAPTLNAWDRLRTAVGAFCVAQPASITAAAARLGAARAEMARHDLPEPAAIAWSALQVSIGAALVSAPHELSASIERLEQRCDAMTAAIWDLSALITPEQAQTLADLSAADGAPEPVSRRSRR